MTTRTLGWTLLILVNALVWGMLSFHKPSSAAAPENRQPFANAVAQRGQMVRELEAIRALLKEQNSLLRAIANRQTDDDNQR